MNASFEHLLLRAEQLITRIEAVLPQAVSQPDWTASSAFRYRKRSSGRATLEPVRHVGVMALADLKEIEPQKEKIHRNTRQFVLGQRANNLLLTGARGTGKSSLIRACLNEFAAQGLRLIEVDKADLTDLPDIIDLVSDEPYKFIVFCDDLSFDEGESGYKALKSILDGSVAATTANVLIYATSNRRHLLPEYMKENLSYTHTADGVKVAREAMKPGVPMIVLETALPAKFNETIQEALGHDAERPAGFENIESLPQRFVVMPADAAQVKQYITVHTGL